MSREHPIENLMKSTMENIRDMVDVNTIIGDAIETRDGTYIIPISRVSFGFASGGTEFNSHDNISHHEEFNYPFGGGSGAGVSVRPVAFLVVKENSVRLLPVEQDTTYDRIVDTVPQVIEMLKDAFCNKDDSKCHQNNSKANSSNVSTTYYNNCEDDNISFT